MRIERRNDLDLRLIEAFAAVIERGTTTAAADHLGLSQSVVWNAIRTFEAQIGVALFRRAGRRLEPTEEGLCVYEEIRPLLGALDGLAGRLRALKKHKRRRLVLAATSAMGCAVVPIALRRFMADAPQVEINLNLDSADAVARAVELGLADLGVVQGPVSHAALKITVLGTAELVAVLPQDHLLTTRAVVGPTDLVRHTLIAGGPALTPLIRGAFSLQGVQYAPSLSCDQAVGACALVHAGLGVAVVDPYSAAMSRGLALVTRRFSPTTSLSAVALQRGGGDEEDPLASALLLVLMEAVASLAPAGWG
ncbi:LysR family transcriptional regulator [Aquamicrobium sp. LC103]|uniref:LysR family transcriptional regulator n=1 Tax=Aquamicrobium sp. LC103 TaxID=1120658 RepID=UPI00063E9A03|nr:LysR family transcriptional regulator [Aquamicrobium sp. LC103]TKT81043.1 LysR family transcriptional regulator [Aquamicrobium sp. LC103]